MILFKALMLPGGAEQGPPLISTTVLNFETRLNAANNIYYGIEYRI